MRHRGYLLSDQRRSTRLDQRRSGPQWISSRSPSESVPRSVLAVDGTVSIRQQQQQ